MSGKEFDTNLFVKFFFSIAFLFTCCFCLMLYVDSALAFWLVIILRLLVLPRNIRLSCSAIHIAPLQARVLFRGFSLHTENLSLHILDGYLTFAFWGSWFRHPRWGRLHEYMVCEALIGTRCRVRRNLRYLKGTVVAVNVETKTVSVQYDDQNTNASSPDEDEDLDAGEEGGVMESPYDPLVGKPADMRHSLFLQPGQRRAPLRDFRFAPVLVPFPEEGNPQEPRMRSEGLGDEVVKSVDAKYVYIRSRAGLLQLHLNGVRLCLYNATSKYLDLAVAAAAAADVGTDRASDGTPGKENRNANASNGDTGQGCTLPSAASRAEHNRRKSRLTDLLKVIGKYGRSGEERVLDAQERDDAPESAELRAARKAQEHNVLSSTFAQRFFNFIGCAEIEICAAQIDIGSLDPSHAYFLHFTFQQGEGRVSLTKDGCPTLDLYRSVVELTLRHVDIRMAKKDSHVTQSNVVKNSTLLERARLLVSSTELPYEPMLLGSASSSELIDDYGIFMDGKDKSTIHLVCYKDTPNVYAGEPVCRGELPTTGVEILIDSPVVRYGPWLEYCRTQLWQYFLPPHYLPLEELNFEVGKPRPNAGFELLIMFLRTTTVEVPFKRRAVVPSPPFGIRDSKRKGMLVATIGEGAQYIQPAFYLLPKEEKQIFQGLFIAKNVTVWANCVLEREAVLCNAESLHFFLDRQDDRLWNGRKLWNILAKISGIELYWYMVYADYFLDLLNDWQFSASMYHNVPLTTETFNTANRVVRDCIPNVKRFEIFLESRATLNINANTHNVVYAENPNDPEHNIMVKLKVQSGSFSMVFPSDQYQLSFENEVARPMEASASELKAYLSLPPSHPLYDQIKSDIPCATADAFRLKGQFTIVVPNQSMPQPRDNFDSATGRTRLHNFFEIDLEFINLRGTLMGTHMKVLCECFHNTFLDNTFTIAPDELFWLLAKLQSHATTGKNKRKEFKNFQESTQPVGNDVEICVTVRLVDMSLTAAACLTESAPQVSLSTGLLTFTYVKQFAVTDTAISLAPLIVRFPKCRDGRSQKTESNFVVGAITVGLTKHFGRMPLKPKVHETVEVHVGGVSLDVSIEQLMVLVEVAEAVSRHVLIEDAMMEAEVAEALSVAELSAEKAIRAGPLHKNVSRPERHDERRPSGQILVPTAYTTPEAGEGRVSRTDSISTLSRGRRESEYDDPHSKRAVEMREFIPTKHTSSTSFTPPPRIATSSDEGGLHDRRDSANYVEMGGFGYAPGESVLSWGASPFTGAQPAGPAPATSGIEQYDEVALHASESESRQWPSRKQRRGPKGRRSSLGVVSPTTLEGLEDDQPSPSGLLFASKVPHDVAVEFAKFREECNKADDDSRDYGVFFLMVNVEAVRGVVSIGDDGYVSVELPLGVTIARSTVNDGNSNRRISVSAKDVGVQMLLSRASEVAQTYLPSLQNDTSCGEYLEVLSLRASVCMRQYVAYPFDNSLEKHRQRQQQFVERNDYEHLINVPFHKAQTQRSGTPKRESGQAAATTSYEVLKADQGSPVISRAQSIAASVTEPATLPRAPLPKAAAAPNRAYRWSTSSPPANVPPPPLFMVGEFLPPTLQANLGAESEISPGITLDPTRAFLKDSEALALSSFSSSQGTPVHRQLVGEANNDSPASSTFLSLSTTLQMSERENVEESNRFATCVSATSPRSDSERSSANKDSLVENKWPYPSTLRHSGVISSATRSLSNDSDEQNSVEMKSRGGDDAAFHQRTPQRTTKAESNGQGVTRNRDGPNEGRRSGVVDTTAATMTALPTPNAHTFYRTFDKARFDDNGTCAVDYWPPQRSSGSHKVRDRTRFHAQLPVVGFYPYTKRESRAPLFFSYSKWWAMESDDNLFAWARCVADNRERSESNSTSRHLHVAFLGPLTLLVTPEAAVLGACAARLALGLKRSMHIHRCEPPTEFSPLSNHEHKRKSVTRPLLPRPHTKKSKARTQQKRWLWESNIVSVAVPTIEVKVLTHFCMSTEKSENELHATEGIYTSTIVLRNLRVLMAHNRPPTGEDMMPEASLRMSLSVRVDTIAAITQIEWEQMKREGNLRVNIPGVWYNTTKDTIAVFVLTQVVCRIKRDLWRGADGVVSNITISDTSLCMTCDFSNYIRTLICLVQDLMNDVCLRVKEDALFPENFSTTAFLPVTCPVHPKRRSSPSLVSFDASEYARSGSVREATQPSRGRYVQGRGFLKSFTLTVLETVRQGQRLVVSERNMSRLVVERPLCNFIVITPSLPRDRNVHVQVIGEVDEVFAAVFPSVLPILHPWTVPRRLDAVASNGWSSKSLRSPTSCGLPKTPRYVETAAFTPSSIKAKSTVTPSSRNDVAEPEHKGVTLTYNTAFTVHQIDLRAQESDTNYLQLMGKELTGCAESRAEGVASRECVQTEALTEAISDRLKSRLRHIANKARERAKRTRYPAPPETTEQLLLHSTISFFAQQMQGNYVADCVMDFIPHELDITLCEAPSNQSLQTQKVFTATVTDVAFVAQFSQQVNLSGDQASLQMTVRTSVFRSPYCVRATETLHPQVHALIGSWRHALQSASRKLDNWRSSDKLGGTSSLQKERGSSFATVPNLTKARHSTAITFQVQATEITGFVGLPQGIVQKFLLPQISCFTASSNGRSDLKVHLHPFTITTHNTPQASYRVVLPHLYILYAQDEIKMLSSVTVGTIAITITPLFINHTILVYEKLIDDLRTVKAAPQMYEDEGSRSATRDCSPSKDADRKKRHGNAGSSVGAASTAYPSDRGRSSERSVGFGSVPSKVTDTFRRASTLKKSSGENSAFYRSLSLDETMVGSDAAVAIAASNDAPSYANPKRRKSFLFLLHGVRLSYLTTMTTLRFTIRSLSVTAETTEENTGQTLHWVVHGSNAQAALVDRDDHNQMVATFNSLSKRTQSAPLDSHISVAYGSSHASSSGRVSDVANIMKAAHPLSGFLWGSVTLSFTLSSGKIDEFSARTALREGSSLSSYSEEMQKALLDSLINSSSKWELAVFEPLVLMRFGLDALVKKCVQETEQDIRFMKEASHLADLHASAQLQQQERFQRLQREKKRIDSFIQLAEKKRYQRLLTMTERVVHDVAERRHKGFRDISKVNDWLDVFNVRRAHKVVASVTDFMVVVPFGDAAYRSILEELPAAFDCGQVDRHIHRATCLRRGNFIPSHALKLKMDDVSFICDFEVIKQLASGVDGSQRADALDGFAALGSDAMEQNYVSSFRFNGRLLALKSHVYFSDGSPLDKSATLQDLLREAPLLGGQGVLTSFTPDEHQRALNSISVTTIEAPLRVEKKSDKTHVVMVVDVSEPKASVSSRILSIMRELAHEQVAPQAQAYVKEPHRAEMPPSSASAPAASVETANTRATHVDPVGTQVKREVVPPPPLTKKRSCLHLHVTGRLEASELAVFCHTDPGKWRAVTSASATAGGGAGKRTYTETHAMRTVVVPTARRRVGFETPALQNSRMRATMDARAAANATAHGASVSTNRSPPISESGAGIDFNSSERFLITSIPFPGVSVQTLVRRGRQDASEDVAIVRVEVRAGTIELSPSISVLAREVEICASADEKNRVVCIKKIMAFVQGMEAGVSQLRVPLHCPLMEILLPMPRAYQSVLSKSRMENVVRLRRPHTTTRTVTDMANIFSGVGESSPTDSIFASVDGKRTLGGITAVHLSITDLRLIFNSEPVASTYFTFYVDTGGSIDFVFNYFERAKVEERFLTQFPNTSLVVSMRQVRAECQTKLEVKSLEVALPEAELTISRRSGRIGLVEAVTVHLPFDLSGSEPNLTVRLHHVSQLFLVFDLWSATTLETLMTARRLFRKGDASSGGPENLSEAPLAHREAMSGALLQTKRSVTTPRHRILYLGLSGAVCIFDLGAGSTHRFTIGAANAAAEIAQDVYGSTVVSLIGRLSNTNIRSEGVLSGGIVIGDFFSRGFLIHNADDAEVFVRSPEQRTFRGAVVMRNVHVNVKERQLKDVFECKISFFEGSAMDGIGEEEYSTTDMNVLLHRSTLGVTPSTVPAFLNFVRSVSTVIAQQRRIAQTRGGQRVPFLEIGQISGGDIQLPVPDGQSPITKGSHQSSHTFSRLQSDMSLFAQNAPPPIPFMGNKLWRVPCGQLSVTLESTTVLLGAFASGEAAAGCVVLSFPSARLSFAECPCDNYNAVKKVLMIESHNVELYRPGTPRIVVMGFKGLNHFEFFTQQTLGSSDVGFTLTLRQTHPWTGNPRFRDFEEIISLIKSFTDKKNADVFHHFGRVDDAAVDTDSAKLRAPLDFPASSPTTTARASANAAFATEKAVMGAGGDRRILRALRSSKFSPQLRFGGDVSVNTEVILNWLGVTEKMLPHVVHVGLCDKLERLLSSLSDLASERVTYRRLKGNAAEKPSSATGGGDDQGSATEKSRPLSSFTNESSQIDS